MTMTAAKSTCEDDDDVAAVSTALRVAISKPGLMISQDDAGRQNASTNDVFAENDDFMTIYSVEWDRLWWLTKDFGRSINKINSAFPKQIILRNKQENTLLLIIEQSKFEFGSTFCLQLLSEFVHMRLSLVRQQLTFEIERRSFLASLVDRQPFLSCFQHFDSDPKSNGFDSNYDSTQN